ncbi:MAG TPA: hypothetical protein VJ836_02155 [Candidatus Saccharimonadales bacterium]|nr:hypothetical protein [Candidatus Saccharimonadales bacterium]
MKKMIIGSLVAITALMGMLAWVIQVHGNGVIKANTAAYELLLDKIYGTASDRYRGEKLLHHRIQNVIKNCMESKGLGYVPPLYAGSSAGVVAPGDLDVATPLSESFGIAERHRMHAQGVEADQNSGGNKPGLEAARSQQTGTIYNAAVDECMAKAIPLEEDYHPAGQQETIDRLLTELRKVQGSEAAKPLITDYQDCLHKAGYKANSRFELYDHVLKQFPTPEQPWSRMAATKQWREAARSEQKAAAADKVCRAKLYHWATGRLQPAVGRLNTDPEVETVRRGWDKIEAGYAAAGLN